MNKMELRNDIKDKIAQMTNEEKEIQTELIYRQLTKNKVFQQASTVLMYWSLPGEVPTHQFINDWDRRKYILLPVVKGDDLELKMYEGEDNMKIGHFGIKEPIGPTFTDYDRIDLCVVPGVAFDIYNHRMGHGRGFYDKLLARILALKIGIAFPQQIVEELPAEPWDVDMDIVMY
jgi:5-formyltetrahydrofolate cyclo-ligase